MFKNRVRTAALAGAIAVATGVSGLAVPANAQTTPQTGNGQNVADGSLPGGGNEHNNAPAVGEVKAADVLRNEANADAAAVRAHEFLKLSPYELVPIEAELEAQAKAKEAEVTALLNKAVKTLNDINATLTAVKKETQAANEAWAKYATAVTLTVSERDALAAYARSINAPADIIAAIENLDAVSLSAVDKGYVAEVNRIANSEESVAKFEALRAVLASYIETEKEDEEDIDNSNKASAINNRLFGYLEGWDNRNNLKRDAIQKTETATSRNIIVLQEAFDRAAKNVRALRVIQAYYGFGVRWLDLYENDTIVEAENTTIRTEYQNFLFPTLEDLAVAAHANVDANSKAWENQAQRIRLLDRKYRTDAPTTGGADKAKEAETARLQDEVKRLADEVAKLREGGNNQTPPPGNNPGTGSGSSNLALGSSGAGIPAPGATVGIVAVVLAILGGIAAAAFPHIQQFLPKF
ncbi:hypothetical protein [Corynebacterium auris]|uniref:hypothetical protein n=1 Tax=Corynebacterium auris TaxID=44750 RepID=UPI0025B41C47|nr:hypothetical protein [Corynebacterium auris]WJY68791.1 hypothetical protein CAURIS_09585 [Corynebacterium auris]